MEPSEKIVRQEELLQLLAETERRFEHSLQQRFADVEARLTSLEAKPERRQHSMEARLASLEAIAAKPRRRTLGNTDIEMQTVGCKRVLTEVSHLALPPTEADLEIVPWGERRFLVEAEHMMPHPEENDYKVLSAREVPPLVEQDEIPSPQYCDDDDVSSQGTSSRTYSDLPQDTWGSGIICIIQELPKIFTGTAGYAQFLRTGFVLFCLILNIALQYLILWFVLKYVTNPAVARLQNLYKDFHSECFDIDGSFLHNVWMNFPARHSLCDATLSEPAFISTMLLIWCTRMLGEFRAVLYLARRIEGLPKVPHADMMINLVEGESGVVHEIVGLTPAIHFTLHLMITVPKLGINVWLTFMGVRWLTSTVSFPDLILNALGLQFIIEIDEMMLTSLYPERMISALQKAKWALPRKRMTVDEDEQDLKVRYHQAIVYIFGLFIFVYVYLVYFQQVLPGFRWDVNADACASTRKEAFTPQCHGSVAEWMTDVSDCFPFGTKLTR